MLSTIDCDIAVNLPTDLVEKHGGSKLNYEGFLFTTEKKHSNDSVRTSGNSQDDQYTTDVGEVQYNISGIEGTIVHSRSDVTED
jgi:hypothetical protein